MRVGIDSGKLLRISWTQSCCPCTQSRSRSHLERSAKIGVRERLREIVPAFFEPRARRSLNAKLFKALLVLDQLIFTCCEMLLGF